MAAGLLHFSLKENSLSINEREFLILKLILNIYKGIFSLKLNIEKNNLWKG
jgi:hypothetical protein